MKIQSEVNIRQNNILMINTFSRFKQLYEILFFYCTQFRLEIEQISPLFEHPLKSKHRKVSNAKLLLRLCDIIAFIIVLVFQVFGNQTY